MFHRLNEVLRAGTGIVVPGATVTVYVNGTDNAGDYTNATKATIYASKDGGTPVANSTVAADQNGEYEYYAPDGVYDEVLKYGSVTETSVYLQMYDLANAGSVANAAQIAAVAAAAAQGARDQAALSAATAQDAANAAETSRSSAATSETNAAASAAAVLAAVGSPRVLSGRTDPTSSVGQDGDLYINTSTWTLFGPKAGTWQLVGILIGGGSAGSSASSVPGTIDSTITPPVKSLVTANLTYPPQFDDAFDDTVQVGDTLCEEWANDSGFSSGVTDSFKLIDSAVAAAHAASFTGLSALASGVHYFRSCIIRGPANTSRSNWSNTVIQGLLLSAATSTPAATTAAIGCTSNEGGGTLYCVVTTTNSQPSVPQIKAGQNAAGTAAAFAANQAVSAAGAKTFNATGLTGGTVYYDWFYQESGAVASAVLGGSFTTITGSVAKLTIGSGSTGAGANRSQWINSTDGLAFAMNVDIGDCIMDRSTDTMPGQAHAEVTIGTLAAHVFAGIVDSGTALGAATVPGKPGSAAGPNGFAIDVNAGNTTAGVWINGGFSGVTLAAAPVAGDTIMWEYDSSAKTVLVKHKRASGGTITTLFTGTLTSKIPTTPTAFGGGWNNTDGGTYNFGASAWAISPTSGYQGW